MSFNIPKFQQPSVMAHNFSQVPHADIPRSTFRRPFSHKTTFNPGLLIPIYADEALPGDTFKVHMNAITRIQALLRPIMDNLYIDIHFFAVPYRLVWDNFQKFMGEQENPGDSTDYLMALLLLYLFVAKGGMM